MTDPQDLSDFPGSRGESIWEQEFDRRRLVGKAIVATVGAAFLGGPGRGSAREPRRNRVAVRTRSQREGEDDDVRRLVRRVSGVQSRQARDDRLRAVAPERDRLLRQPDGHPHPSRLRPRSEARQEGVSGGSELAKSWTVSSDRTVYRLHLRPNVRSSRGNRFTANDVVWSLSKAMDGKFVAAFLLVLCGIAKPDQLKVINSTTLDIHLTAAPPPYFMQILGLPWVPIFDSTEAKKHTTSSDPFAQDWLDKNMAGFGPYKLQSTISGKRSVLVVNPNYWGKKPQITKITQDGIDDSGSRLQLLLTGVADYAEELTPLQLDQVARSSRAAVTGFEHPRRLPGNEQQQAAVQHACTSAGDRPCDPLQRHHQDRLQGSGKAMEDADHTLVPGSDGPILEVRDEPSRRPRGTSFRQGDAGDAELRPGLRRRSADRHPRSKGPQCCRPELSTRRAPPSSGRSAKSPRGDRLLRR